MRTQIERKKMQFERTGTKAKTKQRVIFLRNSFRIRRETKGGEKIAHYFNT